MYDLFIDDERFPPEDGKNWMIARSSAEAMLTIEEYGIPDYISFDHDLGGKDTSMIFIKEWIEKILDGEKETKEKFLEMKYFVHSQNPIGKKNIEYLIDGFMTSLKNDMTREVNMI